jgi:hypothetical protein
MLAALARWLCWLCWLCGQLGDVNEMQAVILQALVCASTPVLVADLRGCRRTTRMESITDRHAGEQVYVNQWLREPLHQEGASRWEKISVIVCTRWVHAEHLTWSPAMPVSV